MMRAMVSHETPPTARKIIGRFWPKTTVARMTMSVSGKVLTTSTPRIRRSSARPPTSAANTP
jgi:hypothetical protein